MNKTQVKGRAEQAGGKIKEVAGKVTGDRETEAEGKVDKNIGKVKGTAGDIKEDLKPSHNKR